jgi:hypothetical protein
MENGAGSIVAVPRTNSVFSVEKSWSQSSREAKTATYPEQSLSLFGKICVIQLKE